MAGPDLGALVVKTDNPGRFPVQGRRNTNVQVLTLPCAPCGSRGPTSYCGRRSEKIKTSTPGRGNVQKHSEVV